MDHTGGLVTSSCPGPSLVELAQAPSDNVLTTATLSANNYTDQIFVVTDANVNDTNMRNQSLNVSEYTPVTYRSTGDCSGLSNVGCPFAKQINWGINIKDVGAPTGADQYPLCVLQFSD